MANLYQGIRSEYLAQYVFSMFGTVTRVPNEEDHDFRTAAGMIMAHFGRIPEAGEHFDWSGFRFEVVDLDGPRIDKLLVARVPVTTAE